MVQQKNRIASILHRGGVFDTIFREQCALRTLRASARGADNRGYGVVILVYALYIARFFTLITSILGFVVGFALRDTVEGLPRLHLNWLLRLFWYDFAALCGSIGGFIACLTFEPLNDSDWAPLLYLFPITFFMLWNIFMLIALVFGLRKLVSHQPLAPSIFSE